jgi:4-amino-4-deoxy-L-arabinose transferase-like glycosyltransferase
MKWPSLSSDKARNAVVSTAICVLIFLAVWFSRAVAPDAIVTWDEPAWVYRSVKFLLALGRGDWKSTLLVGHPGVLTMWSGALSLAWQRWITGAVSPAQLAAIDALPALDMHNADTIRQLVALLPMAKASIAILHAVIAVVLYLVLSHLLNRPYALVALLFLVTDPYYLSLSRVLHIDALTSGLMAIAVTSVLVYTRAQSCRTSQGKPARSVSPLTSELAGEDRPATRLYLIVSAIAAGLATLTKSYGILVTPFVGLVLLVAHLRERRPLTQHLHGLLAEVALWGGVAILTFAIVWPAMWSAPLNTLKTMLGLSLESASSAGDASAKFFLGQSGVDPGAAFYPIAMFFRTTPLVLVGCLLALLSLVWRRERERNGKVTLYLLAYIVLYVAVITLMKKKFDRYMLPALLGADMLAAVGWMGAFNLVCRVWVQRVQRQAENGPQRLAKHLAGIRQVSFASVATQGGSVQSWQAISVLGVSLLVLLQALMILRPLFPAEYLAYYNPWAGGPREAVKTIPVGWGEGVEQAANYLASKPNAADLHVVTWAVPAFAPRFPGQVSKPTADSVLLADYVLLYVGDMQTQDSLVRPFYEVQKPEFVAKLNGIEVAWLYANNYYEDLSKEIDRTGELQDVIVSNAPSAFDRHYSGALRCTLITGTSEQAVADELQQDCDGARHLFYLEFANQEQVPTTFIERQLSQSALLLWQKSFAYGTLYSYQLPAGYQFQPATPSIEQTANFADQFALESYGFSRQQVEYRQELGLALQWRLLRRTTQDEYLFARLVDAQGQVWGQYDGRLTDDAFLGTSAWQEATSHLCRATVSLLPGIPPGQYWLALGLYQLEDLTRLTITASDEQRWITELRLGPIRVTSASVPPSRADLAIPYSIDQTLDPHVQLLGYDLANATVKSGEEAQVTLFWQCLQKLDQHYQVGLRLVRTGSVITTFQFSPAGTSYPTEQWLAGDMLRFAQRIRIPSDVASGTYDLYLNLYSDGGQPLSAQDIHLAQIQVEHVERVFAVPQMQYTLVTGWGDEIELLGYDLQETQARAGGTVHLTLYWRALHPSAVSYTVFTHLLDVQGIVRGQRDSVPVQGLRPTTGWVENEVIADSYEISIHVDAPSGSLQIEIGFYDAATGKRLSVTREGASTGEDRVLLPATINLPQFDASVHYIRYIGSWVPSLLGYRYLGGQNDAVIARWFVFEHHG